MENITSVNNNHIKELCKLKEKKYRDSSNTYLIEGEHLIYEAYKEGILLEVLPLIGEDFSMDTRITFISKEVMKKLSSTDSIPNVIGVCRKKEEEEIGSKILILEDIQDPGNLGTIIRSSLAFGIDTIVLSTKTVDLYNPKVVRSTQGMMFHVNIVVRELIPFIKDLKKNNYVIYGTKVDNGINVKNVEKKDKYALIIGNEGNGMSSDIESLCDKNLFIDMDNGVESLNAAVAASILLYEMRNK